MRTLTPVLLLLVAALPSLAQDIVQPPAAEPEVRQGRERPSPRLLLVLDVSGSMRGFAISEAIKQAVELAFAPTDDIEVGVIVFNVTHKVIEGPDGPGSVWYRLPSAPNATRLRAAITSLGTGGGTTPASAMYEALLMGAQTVVLITDGVFSVMPVLASMVSAYDELETRGAPHPNVGIIGVGVTPNTGCFKVLEKIAKLSGASFQTLAHPETPAVAPEAQPPHPGHRTPPIGPPLPPDWRQPAGPDPR